MDWEIEELACYAAGNSESETEEIINNGRIDDLLWDKYGIDFECYKKVVKDLLPLTPVITTALLGKKYHAFVRGNLIIVRQEFDED